MGTWIALLAAGLLLATLVSSRRKAAARRIEQMARERVLEENGYFVGRIDYFWAIGPGGVLLICDGEDRITSYCPSRHDAATMQRYFEQHADSLAGVHIDDIYRHIGSALDWGSWDHGVSTYAWAGTGDVMIEVWTREERCTDVIFLQRKK